MNNLGKIAISFAVAYVALKLVSTKPVRNYLLGTAVDTVYYLIKKKLK